MTAIHPLPPAADLTTLPSAVRCVGRALAVEKQYHKFSAAHFLIFADGSAERLHGHNYRVAAELAVDAGDGLVLDFKVLKALIDVAIADLDERLLLPARHPELKLVRHGESLEVRYRERRYVVPADEALVLPIGNTSVEELAGWIGARVARGLVAAGAPAGRLTLSVEETDGQRGRVTYDFTAPAQSLASPAAWAAKART